MKKSTIALMSASIAAVVATATVVLLKKRNGKEIKIISVGNCLDDLLSFIRGEDRKYDDYDEDDWDDDDDYDDDCSEEHDTDGCISDNQCSKDNVEINPANPTTDKATDSSYQFYQ